MAVLVTGATGFLGKELVRSLLAHDSTTIVVPLIRAGSAGELAHRAARLTAALPEAEHRRVRPILGDITRPRLGLTPARYAKIGEDVDRVIHVAATTRFDLPLAEARRVNVAGTAEALAICCALRRHGQSGRLDYVSTAYVAGDRDGVAYEDELDRGQRFRNTYERTKFEAERLCREVQGDLPVAIYRPSIIVGDSGTGGTESYKAFYWPLARLIRFYDLWRPVLTRLAPLPLNPECHIDLVPVDYVARAITMLFHDADAVGHCYHLAAGPEAAMVRDLVTLTCAHFAVREPRYLSAAFLNRLQRLTPRAKKSPFRIVRGAATYYPYVRGNPRFDTTNAARLALRPPPVDSYFARLLRHAYAADFGRRQTVANEGPGATATARAPVSSCAV